MIASYMMMWLILNGGAAGHGSCIYDSKSQINRFIKVIKISDPNAKYVHYWAQECPKDLDIHLKKKLKLRFDPKDFMYPIKLEVK